MDGKMEERLGRLNAYQIAGLAAVMSTAVALAVVALLRRFCVPSGTIRRGGTSSATGETGMPEVPHHFSEDLTIPGLTFTGSELIETEDQEGKHPEGA